MNNEMKLALAGTVGAVCMFVTLIFNVTLVVTHTITLPFYFVLAGVVMGSFWSVYLLGYYQCIHNVKVGREKI